MYQSLVDKLGFPLLNKLSPGSVAMFHIGRSGSTVLGNLLNQNPNILWNGEIYHPYVDWNGQKVVSRGKEATIDPVHLIRKKALRAGRRYYGFEVKFYHLDRTRISLSDYIQRISDIGVDRFIVLKRKNYLRKIVSSSVSFNKYQLNLRSIYSSDHHSNSAAATLHKISLNIDNINIDASQKSLIEHLRCYHHNFQKLDAELENKQALRLTYEDHIAQNPIDGYHSVCDFLGVEKCPVKVNYGKTNPFKLSEIVDNFSDLEKALQNTEFEWMLYQ